MHPKHPHSAASSVFESAATMAISEPMGALADAATDPSARQGVGGRLDQRTASAVALSAPRREGEHVALRRSRRSPGAAEPSESSVGMALPEDHGGRIRPNSSWLGRRRSRSSRQAERLAQASTNATKARRSPTVAPSRSLRRRRRAPRTGTTTKEAAPAFELRQRPGRRLSRTLIQGHRRRSCSSFWRG